VVVVLVLAAVLEVAMGRTSALEPTAARHGAQPNAGEVRSGSRDGDSSSATAGTLERRAGRRVFGLPVTAALVIGAVLLGIVAMTGFLVPSVRRGYAACGHGAYDDQARSHDGPGTARDS
jgi:hypothetical protein